MLRILLFRENYEIQTTKRLVLYVVYNIYLLARTINQFTNIRRTIDSFIVFLA